MRSNDEVKLTHARLKEVLAYDPATGVFTWRVNRPRRRAGQTAGSIREGGYVVIRVDGELFRAHRLAWFFVHGIWPEHGIDHQHGVKTDNRIDELRDVSPAFNSQNVTDKPTTGVERRPCGTYRARLRFGAKLMHVGTFDTLADAKTAYVDAKRALHPGFVERGQGGSEPSPVPTKCPEKI